MSNTTHITPNYNITRLDITHLDAHLKELDCSSEEVIQKRWTEMMLQNPSNFKL
jgi:hypothetical protein